MARATYYSSSAIGASPLLRPDLSNQASPFTYVDKNDPRSLLCTAKTIRTFLVQSYLLKSYLDLAQVKNEITVVKDAPHYGSMFDSEEIRTALFKFLEQSLK
jgi:hypothetical protein